MGNEPKISVSEIVLITECYLIIEAIGIGLVLVGLDDFFILDILRFPLSQIYLRIKGVKGTATLIGNILECIPYVGALPNALICWIITVFIDRNPKLAAPLEKAAAVAKPKLGAKTA